MEKQKCSARTLTFAEQKKISQPAASQKQSIDIAERDWERAK